MQVFQSYGSDSIGVQFQGFQFIEILQLLLNYADMIDESTFNSLIEDGKHQERKITFKLKVIEGQASIKFPCLFSIALKNLGQIIASSQNKVKAEQGKLIFNEEVIFEYKVIFDLENQYYMKKDIYIVLLLESARRPGEQNLVGRISIDLSSVLNNDSFKQPSQIKLDYSSVNSFLTFSLECLGVKTQMVKVEQNIWLEKQDINEDCEMVQEKQIVVNEKNIKLGGIVEVEEQTQSNISKNVVKNISKNVEKNLEQGQMPHVKSKEIMNEKKGKRTEKFEGNFNIKEREGNAEMMKVIKIGVVSLVALLMGFLLMK